MMNRLANFAFNFILRLYITAHALASPALDKDYYKVWTGLKSFFTGRDEAGPVRCRSPRHRMPFNSRNKVLSACR